jgi:hypothetical protein
MERELPTVKEFDEMLIAHRKAAKERESLLFKMFIAIGGASVFIMFVASSLLSKSNIIWAGFICMAGLASLPIYIVATSWKWDRDHGIFCHKCGADLYAEFFEAMEYGYKEMPKQVGCPKCGSVVAQN